MISLSHLKAPQLIPERNIYSDQQQPRLADILDDPKRREWPEQAIKELLKTSEAERSQEIADYTEDGASEPKKELRCAAKANGYKISESTTQLLRDLYQQKDYQGYAFRLFYARPEVADKVFTPGTRVADFATQSASIHLGHAHEWMKLGVEHEAKATQAIILVFDTKVPKKNIASGFLMDHVLVMPGEVFEVSEKEERPDAIYVMLKHVQLQDHEPVYSSFDGTELVDFHDKKAHLDSVMKSHG